MVLPKPGIRVVTEAQSASKNDGTQRSCIQRLPTGLLQTFLTGARDGAGVGADCGFGDGSPGRRYEGWRMSCTSEAEATKAGKSISRCLLCLLSSAFLH